MHEPGLIGAVDRPGRWRFRSRHQMKRAHRFQGPEIVGSIGSRKVFDTLDPGAIRASCQWIEIRLDLLSEDDIARRPWADLPSLPLLFTARCESEGGAPGLDAETRARRLQSVLDDAAMIDIEMASAAAMGEVLEESASRSIPWLASFHDFHGVPAIDELEARREAARNAGAVGFKAAIALGWEADALSRLGLFLARRDDFPVSLMGMGPLAPASRLLFAQLGSVLNYGYLGDTPTAPGQWSAAQLAEALRSVQVRDTTR